MREIFKTSIRKLINACGYSIESINKRYHAAIELSDTDIDLIKFVHRKGYTMVSVPRLINTVKSCKYVIENGIPGVFVECGVWRGGNSILAKLLFEELDPHREVWMFDTFAGMTAPNEFDVTYRTHDSAEKKYKKMARDTHTEWVYASLEEVRNNCLESGLKVDEIKFIKGDVCETLTVRENIPKEISILRLDTDFYESTKVELEVLYPKLSTGGVLMVDDYGHWQGSRKAVDEYFLDREYKPLLSVVDHSGRCGVKL